MTSRKRSIDAVNRDHAVGVILAVVIGSRINAKD